jgi:hypothetical protein
MDTLETIQVDAASGEKPYCPHCNERDLLYAETQSMEKSDYFDDAPDVWENTYCCHACNKRFVAVIYV